MVQPLGGMLSFSFLFLGQEALEYSWPFCAGGDGGEGGGCGDGGEGGCGDRPSVCTGAVVLAVSLMSALLHRTTPCSASPNVFSPSPPTKVELKILIVSNYMLDCDGGVARGYRPSMNCSRKIQGQG